MTYQELDFIFPFIVFGYGALMTFVLHMPMLMEIAEQRFPQELLAQMKGHRSLAIICLFVGSFWSLQNIWMS